MKTFVSVILLIFSVLGWAQSPDELFESATQDYANGNFEDAITKYEQILNQGKESSNLYYNLGNAHYKLNQIAPSIYYYEKGLQLDPNHKDIINNLAFAQNMTLDAFEELPKTAFQKFKENTIGAFTQNQWAVLAIIASVLMCVFFLAYFFTGFSKKKKLYFVLSVISLVLLISFTTFAYTKAREVASNNYAIVFEKETDVKSEPNQNSSTAFQLHEGAKIKILDSFNGFYKLELPNGSQGWIFKDDIKTL
ncbi:tetratricopeptide repeat protein [Mesonia sp. K7]|uniref:tetratricopeptide repeat protein n=1 Tax=Mesonia sp. K7 TaxID=2218606 RepID=UPI001314A03B|nr:tetratricopeptide repeat protein [Mesonia sp. K7]